MNAIQSFFRKYNAVPADDRGPSWMQASDESLLGWFNRLSPVVRCGWNDEEQREATAQDRLAQLSVYNDVVAEIRHRAGMANPSGEMVGAAFRASLPVTEPIAESYCTVAVGVRCQNCGYQPRLGDSLTVCDPPIEEPT